MGRFASGTSLVLLAFSCIVLTSCGSSNPTRVVNNSVPTSISLTPSANASLELGKTLAFTPTARNGIGQTISDTFSFQSNNPAVLTVANNGLACAGTWNSLSAPTICTPGSTGTAQLTASALGVSSPPVTVYVHQHITNIVIGKVANQPPTLSTLCLSKRAPSGNPESTLYQAFAFSGNADITGSVGPFTWQSVLLAGETTSSVSLTTPSAGTVGCVSGPQGQCLNQQTATANNPGTSLFFASASGVNSQPLQFTTCAVQSIAISELGNPATSFNVNTGTSTTLNATAMDILGMTITGVPLTWSSSNPVSVRATGATSTVYGSVGTVSASAVGAGAVTASCTPPTCNGGITPSTPIYPAQAVSFDVTSNSAPSAATAYATSTGCNPPSNATNQTCFTRVVPISRTSATTEFTAGAPVNLPFAPNSILFNESGTNAYLGVNSLSFGTQGTMVLSGTSVSTVPNVAGKVLATSPDGATAIFSDTADTPNRVFICQNCNGSSPNVATFLFDGASAAAFSPDSISGGFKAYVVSGKSCPGTSSAGCLLVFSRVDAAKIVPLSAPASDVTFIGNGTLGYIAGGNPAGAAFLPTCDDPAAPGSIGSVTMAAQMIRALPDGQSALALSAPDLQTVTAQIGGTPAVGVPGCPAPRGFVTISNTVNPAGTLGVSAFTPTQFFLSPDGSTAYVLGETGSGAAAARLPFIIAFNLATQSASDFSLVGNAVPLSASLSPAGDFLFVGADDGTVHVINTVTQLDSQQVTLPFPQSSLCLGPGNPSTAVETDMTVTGASQSGSNTTYTYTSLSGPALQVGGTIVVAGMTSPTDNGTFTIVSLGSGTFTVVNANGVTTTGQSGTGRSGIICNPDLVAVRP